MKYLVPISILLCFLIADNARRVLLTDVTSLVFKSNEQTTGKRLSPIPQMTCKSGPCDYSPSTGEYYFWSGLVAFIVFAYFVFLCKN